MSENFDRARRIAEAWPAWKRNFTLTKYSISGAMASRGSAEFQNFLNLLFKGGRPPSPKKGGK